MKKISRNTLPKQFRYIGLLLLVVCGLCLLFLRGFFSDSLWRLLAVVYTHNPISIVTASFQSNVALQFRNKDLEALVASQTAIIADRNMLYQENIDLKKKLNRDASTRTVLASILARPPLTPYDTLIIDVGEADGVLVGEYVSAGGGALIGEIDSVQAHTARVVLFSSSSQSHQALLLQTTAHETIPITIEGQGGLSMIAEIPAHTAVAVGDVVSFPNISTGIEAEVSHVEAKQGESFEKILLHLPTNPLQLRYVEVVLK